MFYFTCNEPKIYEKVSLFEISYKKMSSHISFGWEISPQMII